MILIEELKKIDNLSFNTKFELTCTESVTIKGLYRGYTSAEDNEPEKPQIDILSTDGVLYGIMEDEIVSIKVIS